MLPKLGLGTWLRRPAVRGTFWTIAVLTAAIAGVCARERILQLANRLDPSQPIMDRSAGTLFIAGGGRLSERLKREFIHLAGGETARIVVIPGCQVEPSGLQEYANDWKLFGVTEVTVLHADSRSIADTPQFSEALENATGVWLSGGTQSWFSAWYRGTKVEERLRGVLHRGGVIGGTSAGASAMSDVMMAGGRGEPVVGKGLALFPDVIVDQHFLKRNRISRMMKLLDQYPDHIGVGIDEGTALTVELSRGRLAVSGDSYVMAYVPKTTIGESRLEVLKPGDQTTLADLRNPEAAIMPGWIADSILSGE